MVYGIMLVVLGILASPSIILSRKPDAKEWIDKLTPYQGWLGLVFFVWGVWGIISSVLNLDWLSFAPIWWITYLVVSLVEVALGFLLGYGLITKYMLSKSPEAMAKGEQMLEKLRPLQGKLGIAAIALGIWAIVANILFFAA